MVETALFPHLLPVTHARELEFRSRPKGRLAAAAGNYLIFSAAPGQLFHPVQAPNETCHAMTQLSLRAFILPNHSFLLLLLSKVQKRCGFSD